MTPEDARIKGSATPRRLQYLDFADTSHDRTQRQCNASKIAISTRGRTSIKAVQRLKDCNLTNAYGEPWRRNASKIATPLGSVKGSAMPRRLQPLVMYPRQFSWERVEGSAMPRRLRRYHRVSKARRNASKIATRASDLLQERAIPVSKAAQCLEDCDINAPSMAAQSLENCDMYAVTVSS
jgi:hypothetical protein